jgi:hypothetical protein
MAQVTIYLDDAAERCVRAAARKSRVSVSRWVADFVERRRRTDWPPEVRQLAGAWPDFPTLQEIRPRALKGRKIVVRRLTDSAPGTVTRRATPP